MATATLVTRSRIVGGKIETTEGTPIALGAADATIPWYNPALKYTIPMGKRPSPGSASQFIGIPGARSGVLTGQTHLANSGSGTAPAWATTFLAACGMAGTTSYAPVTGGTAANSITAGLYQDGRFKSIAGAAGAFVMKGVSGSPITIDWTFTGKYVAPTSVAIITPTYVQTTAASVPRFAGATVTVGATAYKISEFELDLGNKVALIEDANDATGYYCAYVTDRDPTLKVKLMGQLLSVKDFFADHLAGTTAAFSCAVGTGANNIVTIAAPVCQLMDPPDDEDRDGYMIDSLVFQLCKSAAAGDDEVSVAFS